MVYGGGVVIVVAVVDIRRVVPMLSSSDPARRHYKMYYSLPKKTILEIKVENLLGRVLCSLHDCLNPIFLGGVFPELLFNKSLWFCASPTVYV